jgi:hypothetical protein
MKQKKRSHLRAFCLLFCFTIVLSIFGFQPVGSQGNLRPGLKSAASADYILSVSASPAGGGVVAGGGTFPADSVCTVTATARRGYTFANWTENGTVVSTSASYTFTLSSSRSLVANFIAGQASATSSSATSDEIGQPSAGEGVLRAGTPAASSVEAAVDNSNPKRTDIAIPSVDSNLIAAPPQSGENAGGLTINATFDSSITNNANAAAIQAMINQAVAIYQARFSDPVTINILFRYSTTAVDGTPLGTGSLARSNFVLYNISWTTYINALKADAKTANDATANASLPTSALTTSILPSSAGGRAAGLNTPPAMFADGSVGAGGPYDGIVTLNSAQPWQFTRPTSANNYDALRSTEHEIDEVIGLGSLLNTSSTNYRPQDLFSWSAPGVRSISSSGTRYFSINSGNTNIVGFNQNSNGDFGDWISPSCPQANPYVQNAFSCAGQFSDVTETSPEGINLDVIGYDLVTGNTLAAPTANSGTNVTSSSFTANWSAVSGATGYRLDVSTSSSFNTFVPGYNNLDVGNVLSRSVTGLSPATTYFYRVRAYNAGTTSGNSNTITVATVFSSAQTATYDSVSKAPKCGQVGASCDSGGLLMGRDNITNGPESNQPNTINNSCADGTLGTYHVDESLEAIKISTVDGGNFAQGKTVKVDVLVWAYEQAGLDHLDIYYASDAANPNWVAINTLTPLAAGPQVLSTTFTLPAGATSQAIRANFRYQGTAAPCGANDGYQDHDDLIFTVTAQPSTRTLTVASSNPNSGVSINVSPTDNSGLGNGTTQFTRTYNNNTVVNLSVASTVAGGNLFLKWQRDGVDLTTNTSTSVTMDANHTMTAVYAPVVLSIGTLSRKAARTSGGQQIVLTGSFRGLSSVTVGGVNASWVSNSDSQITLTTPAHAVGAVDIVLVPQAGTGSNYTKSNAFAYLPTTFTDDTLIAGVTTAKAQHILELRQAVDALRAVAGLAPAAWTDPTLTPLSAIIKVIHIQELRALLDDALTRLGYATQPYTDPGLSGGFVIKGIYIDELRQRIKAIAN